jgi:hypothetical protein
MTVAGRSELLVSVARAGGKASRRGAAGGSEARISNQQGHLELSDQVNAAQADYSAATTRFLL